MQITDRSKVIDFTTGEIIEDMARIRSIKKTPQRPFIIVYTDTIQDIIRWSKAEQAVMFWSWEHCEYGTNILRITETDKEEIASILGVKKQSINNAISVLGKCQILIRKGRGHFIVNPLYFWKGRTKDNQLDDVQVQDLRLNIPELDQ